MIDQFMGLVKITIEMAGVTVSSVYECRQTPPIPPKVQQEPYLSLMHKLFRKRIEIISEDNKCFVCENRHPDSVLDSYEEQEF